MDQDSTTDIDHPGRNSQAWLSSALKAKPGQGPDRAPGLDFEKWCSIYFPSIKDSSRPASTFRT